jgi:hypothetical protein
MYIVAIGWLYVVVLMAITEKTFTSGMVTLLLFGVLPIGMLVIVRNGSKRSRRLRREAIRQATSGDDEPADGPPPSMSVKQASREPDGADAERDQ